MIDKLEMFIAVAREGHFGRAAESLDITQPSLSSGLKQLEAQLGVKLVNRGSRFRGLTAEGEGALPWAQRIVADTRQFRDEMRMRRHGLSGALRLAAIPAALVWTAGLAAALSRRHPDIRITLLSRGPRDLLQMLQDFEIDAGITYLDDAPAGRVETRPLCRERHALLCPPSSPFARRAALCWKDLDGAPLALLTPGMQDRRIIDRLLAEGGARPRICLESDSVTALAARVAEGGCVAVLPAGIARLLAGGDRLAQVPIGGGGRVRPVGMLLPRRDPRPPLLAALVTEAQGLAELAGAW